MSWEIRNNDSLNMIKMKIDIGPMFFFLSKYLGNRPLFGPLTTSDGVRSSAKWPHDLTLGTADFSLISVIFPPIISDTSETDKSDNKKWKIAPWGSLLLCYGVISGFSLSYGLRNFKIKISLFLILR